MWPEKGKERERENGTYCEEVAIWCSQCHINNSIKAFCKNRWKLYTNQMPYNHLENVNDMAFGEGGGETKWSFNRYNEMHFWSKAELIALWARARSVREYCIALMFSKIDETRSYFALADFRWKSFVWMRLNGSHLDWEITNINGSQFSVNYNYIYNEILFNWCW